MKKLSLAKLLQEAEEFEFAPFVEKYKQFLKFDKVEGTPPRQMRKLYFEFAPGIGLSLINGHGLQGDWEVAPIKNGQIDEDSPLYDKQTQSFRRVSAHGAEQMIQAFIKSLRGSNDRQQQVSPQQKFQTPPGRKPGQNLN